MQLPPVLRLLRMQQWYKNAVIFVAIIFSLNLFNIPLFVEFCIGFLSLCLVSSSYYIINDIVDQKEDRVHPEKKYRPVAAGTVSIPFALLISVLSFFIAITLAFMLSTIFLAAVLALFMFSQGYIFFFKHEVFLDAIAIAINFVIRATAGILLITTRNVSPWIFMSTFFLAMMIILGKRKAELYHLKELSGQHKKVLLAYKHVPIDALIMLSATFILVAYAIYSVFENRALLVFTIPIAFYALMRYVSLTVERLDIAGNPERVFTDKRMLLSMVCWALSVIIILYGWYR